MAKMAAQSATVLLYRPRIKKVLKDMVNKPIVQSLLYDADLLPEQLESQHNLTLGLVEAYNRLEGVLLAFKYLEINGIPVDVQAKKTA